MSSHTQTPQTVVEAYVEGTRGRDIELLKQIFHDSAIMTGWLGPDFLNGSPEPFYTALETNEVGADYTSNIVSVEISDKIATAELHETNLLGLSFINHFHLAQLHDGTWRITSKLFRHF
ncbi:nuclear transport factor 2 family protein [Gymnodinialimonas sp. 2305UL16-5]|uniref:nuclear transport factor 2 family protein n=1 Tax=Gymnodinialimonas mytili TaxID=3126503 RepID=UPI003097BCB6